jgi:hypothetical protein
MFRPLSVTKILLVLSAIALSCQTAMAERELDRMLDRGVKPDTIAELSGLTPEVMPWQWFECQSTLTAAQEKARWEQAKEICFSRAQAAGIAGAPIDTIIGVNAFRDTVAQLRIQMSVARACMAERGLKIETLRAREARCAKR